MRYNIRGFPRCLGRNIFKITKFGDVCNTICQTWRGLRPWGLTPIGLCDTQWAHFNTISQACSWVILNFCFKVTAITWKFLWKSAASCTGEALLKTNRERVHSSATEFSLAIGPGNPEWDLTCIMQKGCFCPQIILFFLIKRIMTRGIINWEIWMKQTQHASSAQCSRTPNKTNTSLGYHNRPNI